MTLSPTALEAAAKAVEQDLSRDIAAWVERYTGPHGCDDDAPEPPKGNYRSTPTRLATAAITAYLAQTKREGSEMTPAATADLLRFVIDHYANQDMNHADFRVYAYQIAQRIVEPTDASN